MLSKFAGWITYEILQIARQSRLGDSVSFFIYDVIKIFALLAVIIFAISIIRSFLPPEKVRDILAGKKQVTGHFLAGLLGILTPFCSCSAVPLFLGFVNAGVPLGITFTFLVASPMINEVALILLAGMFGLKIALIYIFSGLLVAMVSGFIIGKLKVEELIEKFAFEKKQSAVCCGQNPSAILTWNQRARYAKDYTLDIIRKVWPYILAGVALGSWIHGYVPVDFLSKYAGKENWYAVPFAVLLGIPLYSNAAGVIPLVSALTEKGVAMGTTLAFMMAVTGLSLPEFMILKTVMKTRLIVIFAGIVGIGIIFTGYMFNLILK